jgi:hypothetical protein
MIGPTKLATIREHVRKSFDMTDAELLAWFNQQLEDRQRKPAVGEAEINALRLLRDALRQDKKRPKSKRRRRRAPTAKR